mmetsp:Transcript_18556/g.25529  ORF Transcript_18556/g.25529 Transcript_18556/m.25529 type:complete len:373 (-) Transcript_18556:137-1255(-)|eukprot:CAMPEP_0185735058 /NCGR_PEP_ID=MMETSP1171-20130828/24209_1 /TAXON_ID=374046 /ORGANISM="Helicotheca tamensis, Strain CCMP826" /LENGTH=372 /DNA_ID=CAMNT_0028405233 /DNA_START=46 /DNA_END=1164 /DNA_ORIENTATION=-
MGEGAEISKKWILVTGGCGFIGSHTLVPILEANYSIVVVDDLSNSNSFSLDRVAEIVGLDEKERAERIAFYKVNLCDEVALRDMFESCPTFVSCIHFAGLKAVGDSTREPLKYYHNNLTGIFNLLSLMEEFNCRSFVFSSSATVYGFPETMPITESAPVGQGITNAYGRTKFMSEEVLRDFHKSAPQWSITILRYFNPVGAHPSGLIGEDPNGIPNNLMPYVSQVAVGRREHLTVFGGDYDTPDGTGVRDYLHVMDLAEGHLSAIRYMEKKGSGLNIFNLGTGNGYSVLDLVKAMEKACGHEIEYVIGPRRPGDISTCYADASLAKKEMGWSAEKDLDDMCKDTWCWQEKNPQGYTGKEGKILPQKRGAPSS